MRCESPLSRASQFRRDDPIARLIVHYYYPCDLMHRDYNRVRRALSRQKRRTKWRASQELCYLRLWLSLLFAVTEGFKELGLRDQEIESLLADEAIGRLKRLRNGTFHYQQGHEKLTQFFRGSDSSEVWAEHLHAAFDRFFRGYRIDLTAKNLLAMDPPDSDQADAGGSN